MPRIWLDVTHRKQSDPTGCLNDPFFDEAPQHIPLPHFLLAWSHFDYTYAVIRPIRK